MGTFRTDIRVCRPGRRARTAPVRNALVDTGSELSWLPEAVLESVGVEVFKRGEAFARTLERFNASVDLRRKRLVAACPMPAA